MKSSRRHLSRCRRRLFRCCCRLCDECVIKLMCAKDVYRTVFSFCLRRKLNHKIFPNICHDDYVLFFFYCTLASHSSLFSFSNSAGFFS